MTKKQCREEGLAAMRVFHRAYMESLLALPTEPDPIDHWNATYAGVLAVRLVALSEAGKPQ
jgi:hypothetical protein